MGVLRRKSDKTTLYRVGSIDKRFDLDAKTTIYEERRVRGSQLAKNYINWVERRKVIATLVLW